MTSIECRASSAMLPSNPTPPAPPAPAACRASGLPGMLTLSRPAEFPMTRLLTRRDMLLTCANGFGAVALAALLAEEGRAAPEARRPVQHHTPTAKNVIFLYMDGGPSQVDTFDYKPNLEKYHGRDPHSVLKVEPTQFDNV